ncbi:MAG TPA: glycosyltransferase [Acidimicrobiales bacterium]|nr:glycosyltransferase [Acidimicrobiales bacterium]
MDEVEISPRPPEMFERLLGEERAAEFLAALAGARSRLEGHTVWHVNSTAAGGGVAEMLQSILSYPRGADIDVRWLVAEGNEEFFEVTKRIHNLLHGSGGDGGSLGEEERRVYESALQPEIESLLGRVRPGDVAVLHDPQTLGLAGALAEAGVRVIWACHVGADEPSEETRAAWSFLRPYVDHTEAQVFSRAQYRWEGLDEQRVAVIPPCIDAFAPKNQDLTSGQVRAILDAAGIIPTTAEEDPVFSRQDGTAERVTRRAKMFEEAPVPEDAPVVCQVSRWDPLKDHQGIMVAFAAHVPSDLDVHLILAGPAPEAVSDDPEGEQTLRELIAAWEGLPDAARAKVHLCCVPMADLEENAAVINALQRRSDVVVQKSLAEGFGLTVAEAMWKGRPTLGSRIGGIQDQIDEERSGLLVDPNDGEEFAASVAGLLRDPAHAAELGGAARKRVLEEYLPSTYLTRQFALIGEVLDRDAA